MMSFYKSTSHPKKRTSKKSWRPNQGWFTLWARWALAQGPAPKGAPRLLDTPLGKRGGKKIWKVWGSTTEFRTDSIFHTVTYPKLHFPTKIQQNRIEIAKVFYFGVISGWLGWVVGVG